MNPEIWRSWGREAPSSALKAFRGEPMDELLEADDEDPVERVSIGRVHGDVHIHEADRCPPSH